MRRAPSTYNRHTGFEHHVLRRMRRRVSGSLCRLAGHSSPIISCALPSTSCITLRMERLPAARHCQGGGRRGEKGKTRKGVRDGGDAVAQEKQTQRGSNVSRHGRSPRPPLIAFDIFSRAANTTARPHRPLASHHYRPHSRNARPTAVPSLLEEVRLLV
jgi:hypothetical protein